MIPLDTKFFENLICCLEGQKTIHLLPLKHRIELQQRIDNTVMQCKEILRDAVADEKRNARRKSMFIIPESSMFDSELMRLEDYKEDEPV